MSRWTTDHMPDQTDRVFLITGANSGLGFESTRALAARGAHVVMACRSVERGEAARDAIMAEHPEADLRVERLDLADLNDVHRFAECWLERKSPLHVLMNNAGIMAVPLAHSPQGFESQFAVNHLGPFALTLRLMPPLQSTAGSRVVNVSSMMHHRSKGEWGGFKRTEASYSKSAVYADSKLCNVLFSLELSRRLAGSAPLVATAHPGFSDTNLMLTSAALTGSSFKSQTARLSTKLFAQSAEQGALPQLHAATAPTVESGDFYGPDGFWEMQGWPTRVRAAPLGRSEEAAERLWSLSEQATGLSWSRVAASPS